jgi:hypothetical protein
MNFEGVIYTVGLLSIIYYTVRAITWIGTACMHYAGVLA